MSQFWLVLEYSIKAVFQTRRSPSAPRCFTDTQIISCHIQSQKACAYFIVCGEAKCCPKYLDVLYTGDLRVGNTGSVTSRPSSGSCLSLSSGIPFGHDVCVSLVLNTSPTLVRRAGCSSGSA